MFKSKTLFVVGAGASKEVNFPVGEELKNEIARLWDIQFDSEFLRKGDPKFYSCLEKAFRDRQKVNSSIMVG
jgi:hypothetical protein